MTDLASRIVRYMQAKEYQIFTLPLTYNIVYLEGCNADGTLNSDAPNWFNDRRLVLSAEGNRPKILGNWEATTEPGNHYTQHPMNPAGAALIAFGQYAAWRVGIHGRSEPHEALIQALAVTVHRDLNKDFLRTGDRTAEGLYGINQHWGYDRSFNNINNASAGCLVGRSRQGHREFMTLIKSDRRYITNRNFIFTTTVIASDDLVKMQP